MAALSTAVAVADQLSVHRPQVVGASNCDIPSLTHNPRTGKLEVSDAALGGRSAGTYQYAKPMEHSWQPYELNGGSVVALAGDDFAVIAADTRLSRDYSILSRNVSKLRPLNSMCVVGTGGCWADVSTLHKILKARCVIYENDHEQEMVSARSREERRGAGGGGGAGELPRYPSLPTSNLFFLARSRKPFPTTVYRGLRSDALQYTLRASLFPILRVQHCRWAGQGWQGCRLWVRRRRLLPARS